MTYEYKDDIILDIEIVEEQEMSNTYRNKIDELNCVYDKAEKFDEMISILESNNMSELNPAKIPIEIIFSYDEYKR